VKILGNPAIRAVHGPDRQVFETTPLLISVQHHIIGIFEGRALSCFVQSNFVPCFAYSCGTPGRKSEDVRIVFPLEPKKLPRPQVQQLPRIPLRNRDL
jgi:hypothetical protein